VVAAGTDPANVSARVELGGGGATVGTGLPVLDFLVGELARSGRLRVSLEVAPDTVDRAVAAAGRALGEELAPLLRAPGASGFGFAWLPADEALAGAVIEITDSPLVAANVDFSGQRVGGLGSDVIARFVDELAAGAGLNVHIRVLEGRDPEHVLRALFKALGAAIGQACRTPEGGSA
jgi:imidazoleglycerol-phosphate dehydratase